MILTGTTSAKKYLSLFEIFLKEYNTEDNVIVPVDKGLLLYDQIRTQYPDKKITAFQYQGLDNFDESNIETLKNADQILSSDYATIDVLKNHGIESKFVPYIYNDQLKKINTFNDPKIDVLYYGIVTARIFTILKQLSKEGLNVLFLEENYSDYHNSQIGNAKIVLNLHEYDHQSQEQIKIAYALANNKCVLSERSPKNYFTSDISIELLLDR